MKTYKERWVEILEQQSCAQKRATYVSLKLGMHGGAGDAAGMAVLN